MNRPPRIRLETLGVLLAFLMPAVALSHAMEDASYGLGASAVVVVALVWRNRWSGGPILDLIAALFAGALTWFVWRQSRMPTAALGVSILSLQSYKLLFPRLTQARPPAGPFAQHMFPEGSEREAAVVEAASLVLLGAASAQSFRPSFAPLFALGAVGLLLGRVGCARSRARSLVVASTTSRAAPRPPQPVRARMAVATLAGGLLVGAFMLFATPRLGTRYLPQHLTTSERMSGFSDQVGLDDIGRLQQSTAPAFHVEPLDGTSLDAELYWRGAALDRYDGERWSHSEAGRLHARLRGRGQGLFDATRLWGRDAPGTKRVVLYLEPLGTRMLFTTGAIRSMRFRGLSPGSVWRTELATLYTKRAYSAALCYELEYHPNQVPLFLDNTPLAKLARQRCLQLPATVDRERLRNYAEEVLSRAGVDSQAPLHAVASALELHLQSEFEYSLEGARTADTEPIADFLFTRRTGHCEVFASALAVLLRCVGIPARVITGYRSRPEADASSHTVRQSDAHAWVEAKTDRLWQRYEPTPAASWTNANVEISWLEQIELLWFKWIVAYDAREQMALFSSIVRWVTQTARALGSVLAQPGSLLLLVLAGFGLAGGWFVRKTRRLREHVSAFVPGRVLQPLLAELTSRGHTRSPGETLGGFAQRVDTAGAEVSRAIHAYYAARFGGEQGAVAGAVAEALSALEHTPPSAP